MKKIFSIYALLCISILSSAQKIVKDEYQWHNHRIIETEETNIPVLGDIKVKVSLQYNITKGSSDYCLASFTIGYKKTNLEYISYPLVIKTSSGKIHEMRLGTAKLANSNILNLPSGWTTIYWYFVLDKKNLKYFTKEDVEKMKIRIGDDSIDLVFADKTLTNYIRDGYELLKMKSKTKISETENPPKYNGF